MTESRKLFEGQHFLRSALALAYAAEAVYRPDPSTHKPFVDSCDWTNVVTFSSHSNTHDTEGFVAASDKNLVVAFRGTEPNDIRDWITDLQVGHHDRRVHGGRVHSGFWNAWLGAKDEVLETIAPLLTTKQSIWFVGHSLGGALAMLAARDLNRKLKLESVVNFGSPRAGDPAFAEAFDVPLIRFVNEDDMVPHVPFRGWFPPYEHAGTGFTIMPDGKVTSKASEWRRRLLEMSRALILDGDMPATKPFRDHKIESYIKKLELHPINR